MTYRNLSVDADLLAALCRRWRIRELDVFGSVLRDDFGPDSDIDLLFTYAPDASLTLFDEVQIQDELESLLGRRVDLLSRGAVEDSPNWLRRKEILESAEPIYVETN
jgi:predicted nucleotidyltransferase